MFLLGLGFEVLTVWNHVTYYAEVFLKQNALPTLLGHPIAGNLLGVGLGRRQVLLEGLRFPLGLR